VARAIVPECLKYFTESRIPKSSAKVSCDVVDKNDMTEYPRWGFFYLAGCASIMQKSQTSGKSREFSSYKSSGKYSGNIVRVE